MSVSPSKSFAGQAYDTLNWVAGVAVNAATATASAIKTFISFGVDENPRFVKEMEAANNQKAAIALREYNNAWTKSQPQVRARQKINRVVETALRNAKPNRTWISEAYLRDYGVLPPFTDDEKIQYSQQANYVTSYETFYNTIHILDPDTGYIYERATGELVPRRQAGNEEFKE